MAMEMDDAVSPPTERMPTRSSARLAEKLKKLMEMPKQDAEAMECELDDAKKRSRAQAKKEAALMAKTSQASDAIHQDIKRSRNGPTPPPIAIEHARHDRLTKATTERKANDPMDSEKTAETMETIVEDDELKETAPSDGVAPGNTKEDAVQDTVNEMEGQRNVSVNNDQDDDTSEASNDNPERGDKPARDDDQPEVADKADVAEVISVSSDEEPAPVQQVDPKKWRELHDEWLHAAMRASMGDTTLRFIPDLDNIERVD